jgi:hypothetical protein
MFELSDDEKVVDYQSPLKEQGGIITCSECSQIAFRVFVIGSSSGQREVGLCGGHYNKACMRYPEMRFIKL